MAFVFSFLVLLVIGTVPPTTHAFTINLRDNAFLKIYDPEKEASIKAWQEQNAQNVPVNKVTISRHDQIQWNGKAITEGQLVIFLLDTMTMQPEPELLFEPDPSANYGSAIRVLYIIKASGVTKFSFAEAQQHCRFQKAGESRASINASPQFVALLDIVLPSLHHRKKLPDYQSICPEVG